LNVLDDMKDPHEAGCFLGVPAHYPWALKPNLKPLDSLLTKVHTEMTAWGQVYLADADQPVLNARVAIRNIRTWILIDEEWLEMQGALPINGAYFVSDFRVNGPGGTAGELHKQELDDGAVSVRPIASNNFHFWPANRATFDPAKVSAILTAAEFRLVRDRKLSAADHDGNGVDDLEQAKFQANIGGDLWLPGKSWKWMPGDDGCVFKGVKIAKRQNGCAGNIGMGQGTARYVTAEWTPRYGFYAFKGKAEDVLASVPPPLDGYTARTRKP
jgi:hypothetical protein